MKKYRQILLQTNYLLNILYNLLLINSISIYIAYVMAFLSESLK